MSQRIFNASLLLALASLSAAQFGGPPGGNPYSNGGDDNGGDDNGNNPYAQGGEDGFGFGPPIGVKTKIIAHAACATVAFGLLFPVGGIMIRLFSFRGLWIVHGIFQIIALIIFMGAVGLGIWMARSIDQFHEAHPIIGLVCFALLLIQPILGFIHHFAFKKYSRRVFWSYAHLWIGRFVITLGIINGGLGLQLSKKIGFAPPQQSTIIAYGVVAGVIWLIYVASAIYGENKRKKSQYAAVNQQPPYKREEYA